MGPVRNSDFVENISLNAFRILLRNYFSCSFFDVVLIFLVSRVVLLNSPTAHTKVEYFSLRYIFQQIIQLNHQR